MKEINLQGKTIKRIVYLLAVICSIYFSYLINHAYAIGSRISIVIALILSAISIWLLDILYKYVDMRKISKRALCILGIISIVISSIVLLSDFNFFTKKFTKNKIIIEVLSEKNEQSKGKNVSIQGILQGNTLKELNEIKLSKGWKYFNNQISTTSEKAKTLTLSLKKSNRNKIVFQTSESSGKLKIIDGKYEEIIDLYSYKTGMKDYIIKGNCYVDSLFVIRLICSYGMILFITFILSIGIYHLYKKEKSIVLPVLLIILAFRCFYYSNLQAYTIFNDTASYIEYNFEDFIHLKFPARTPIYPAVIFICKCLFGLNLYLNFVVLFQIFISFIAVIYFYKTLKLLIHNKTCIALITLIYGITPAICGYDNCILTESLALSGYVFFIYHVIKYIKEANLFNGLSAVGISLLFTFLRPTCIILTVILFAFWIARFLFDRKQIKNDLYCFAGSIISIIFIIIYSVIFYQTHQIYSISDPTIRQDLFICIDQGFYKASDDMNFINDIENKKQEVEKTTKMTAELKIWEIERKIQEKYGNKRVQELTAYCKKQMKKEYIHYLEELIKKTYSTYYTSYSRLIMNSDNFLLSVQVFISKIANFSYVYIMILAELGIMIYKWIKEKKVPWIHAGIFAFSFTIMVSSFIGTNAEYMRTSIGVVPFLYLSVAIFIDYLYRIKKNCENKM